MRLLRLSILAVFLCLAACPLLGDAPDPPTALDVTVGVMWADLVWADMSGGDFLGYKVYRRVVIGEEEGEVHLLEDYDLIARSPGTGNWYHDIEVEAEVKYAYVVTVYDNDGAGGEGEESGPCEEVVTGHAIWQNIYGGGPAVANLGPDAPDGLAVTIGVGWTDLTWYPNNESDLWGYVVYRRVVLFEEEGVAEEDRKLSDYEPIAVGGQESYHDTNVWGGVMYAYAVTAVDNVENESAPSEEVVTEPIWGDGGGGGGGCFLSLAL